GTLGQFEGLSFSLIGESFKQFFTGGLLLFVLSMPIIFITLVMKNYVPTIIFTIVITLIYIMTANSEYRDLFYCASAGSIANNTCLSTYTLQYSYMSIIFTFII